MPEKYDKLRSNMSFNVTAGIVLLLAVFSIIVSAIGILSFTESFKKEHLKFCLSVQKQVWKSL